MVDLAFFGVDVAARIRADSRKRVYCFCLMSLFALPILTTFLLLATALFLLGAFWIKGSLICHGLGIVLLTLYLINALLLGFDAGEIIATTLVLGLLLLVAIFIKEKRA